MPKIASISVSSHANNLGGEIWNPAIRWTTKHAVFVRISTDCGHSGIGECWCFDNAADALVQFLRTEVVSAFLGADLSEVEDIATRLLARATLTGRHGILSSALSGIDIAAHDALAKAAERPLFRQLSPSASGSVELYGSGGLYGKDKDTAALVAEMRAMADKGYRAVKMKIGALTVDEDIARVRAVLDALPTTCSVIVDAVYSYGPAEALRVFETLPAERIEAFQSPIAANDLAGMAWLVRNGVPVMAVEAEHRPEIHKVMIDQEAVVFLQTAPVACGGISRVRALSAAVADTQIRLSLEVSSTAVALAAACHLAAADARIVHVEHHTVHTVFFDELPLGPTPGAERISLPDTRGLGMELPEEQLTHHFEQTQTTHSKIPLGDDEITQQGDTT